MIGCARRDVYIKGYSEARSSHEGGEYAKAIEQYEAYVAEHPDSPLVVPILYQIAECHEAIGNTEQAATHYRKIVEVAPASTWASASRHNLERLPNPK